MKDVAAGAGITTRSGRKNYYRWVEPDSDITVCLELNTVDRLQREILRDFDSSSHTGDEVGGILLGSTELDEGRTQIIVDDFKTVPCQKGPFYTLTAEDRDDFERALASAGPTASVVGYYRSHNRDGLFLSGEDLQLIQRYFRGPYNLFLLVKTVPNGGCTAGFFFRKSGHIQSDFTDSEVPLIPVSGSFGDDFPSGQAVDDLPVRPRTTVPAALEERPATLSQDATGARDSGPPVRSMLAGTTLAGIVLAATFAIFRFEGTGRPLPVHGRDGSEIPLITATDPPATPVVAARVPAVKPSAPAVQKTTVTTPPPNPAPAPPRDEPKLPILSPQTRVGDSPVTGEPNAPSSSQSLTAVNNAPLNTTVLNPSPPNIAALNTAALNSTPLNPAPPAQVATAIAPQITAPVQPPSDGPSAIAPRPDASSLARPDAVRPDAVRTVAAPAPVANTFVGPQVIHQVAPAVPRGVGPLITSDVEVDVSVVIDAKGKVAGARIASMKGAAAGLLTIEALKAAQLFRFQPAQEAGHSVPSTMVLTFRFARTAKK